MGDTKIDNKNFNVHHNQEATHLSNSKGGMTDRTDIVKLIGKENVNGRVNQQYLIALASDKLIEEASDYKPFWSRQVAVKVGDGKDGKIQYALVNRNSLIKRLAMNEAELDKSITAGNVHEYIESRLKDLDHIKSCYREANPMSNSTGERKLRLDLAAQYEYKFDNTKIYDESSQLCVAMEEIKVTNDRRYCAGRNELAVKVGISNEGDDEYAILNKNSLLNRLFIPENKRDEVWDDLKTFESTGTAYEKLGTLITQLQKKQKELYEVLQELATSDTSVDSLYTDIFGRPRHDGQDILEYFHFTEHKEPDFINGKNNPDLIKKITSKLWWNVQTQRINEWVNTRGKPNAPRELSGEEKSNFLPPSKIALKEPTIIPEWDEEGKYTLSAVHDFIDTKQPDKATLKKGEIALFCIFNEGQRDEVKGWVTYKQEDLKRLEFTEDEINNFKAEGNDFRPILEKRLEKLHTDIKTKAIEHLKANLQGLNTFFTDNISKISAAIEKGKDKELNDYKNELVQLIESKKTFINEAKTTLNDKDSIASLDKLLTIFSGFQGNLSDPDNFKTLAHFSRAQSQTKEFINNYIKYLEDVRDSQKTEPSLETSQVIGKEMEHNEVRKVKTIEELDELLKNMQMELNQLTGSAEEIHEKRKIFFERFGSQIDTMIFSPTFGDNNPLNFKKSDYLNNINRELYMYNKLDSEEDRIIAESNLLTNLKWYFGLENIAKEEI